MTIRSLKREELDVYEQLTSICYTFTAAEFPVDRGMSEEHLAEHRGVFDDAGHLESAMIRIGMDAQFEGQDTKLLGIGGVVTDPQDRNKGSIRRLFGEILPEARRQGYVFSALYPFSHAFYRKFGYELGIIRRKAELPREKIRRDLPRAASIRRLLPQDDGSGLKAVYDAQMAGRNLAIKRTDAMWQDFRKGMPWEKLQYTYLLSDASGAPISYWIGKAVVESDKKALAISDMAYTGWAGLAAIFAMLRGMNEFDVMRFDVPADMEARFLAEDPYQVEEHTESGGMVRLLDVERGLSLLPAPPLPFRFTVAVSDGMIEENNGTFEINGDGYSVSVTRTESEADLRCGIGGLSLLTVGTIAFADAVGMGLCEVMRPGAEAAMKRLFLRRETHLHLYF